MPHCPYCGVTVMPGEGRVVRGVTFCCTDHFAEYAKAQKAAS